MLSAKIKILIISLLIKNLIFVFSPLVEMLSDKYLALIPLFVFRFLFVRIFNLQFSFYTASSKRGDIGFMFPTYIHSWFIL